MATVLDKIKRHLDPRRDFENYGPEPEKDYSGLKRFLKSCLESGVNSGHATGITLKAALRGGTGGGLLGAFYDATLGQGDGQGAMTGAVAGAILDGGQAFIRSLFDPGCIREKTGDTHASIPENTSI